MAETINRPPRCANFASTNCDSGPAVFYLHGLFDREKVMAQ